MKRQMTVAGTVLAALLLAGCSASGGSMDMDPGAPAVNEGGGVTGADSGALDGDASRADTAIVITGDLVMTVDVPGDTADDIVDLVIADGGSIALREENRDSEGRGGGSQLILRIPSATFEATLQDIVALGEQDSLSVSQTDVGDQVVDLDARITALQTSVDRLLDLMSKATTTSALLEIEQTLSSRQAELDSLTAQRASLADQITYATLSVNLWPPGIVAAEAPDTFWSGLVLGWTGFVATMSALLVALGVMLPWIVTLGLLTLLVIWIVRRATRKGRPVPEAVPVDDAVNGPPTL